MKMKTQMKNFYKRNTMLSIGIMAVGTWYVLNRQGMAPSLPSLPVKSATSSAPVARYAYDASPPVRNEPYTNSAHFFGPADGDPVFYGF